VTHTESGTKPPLSDPAPLRQPLGWLRAACFGYMGALLSLMAWFLGAILLLLTPWSARASHVLAARPWGHLRLWCFGAGFRVEDGARFSREEPRLIVANHASYLDIPTLFAAFPGQGRFVLKEELRRMPFIGWYALLCGHFFLDRSNPREGKRVVDRAVARSRKYGLSPIVFPEGTRSHDGRLAELKAGVFQLAIAAQMPVQPVAILGTYAMMPRGSTYPRRAGEIVVRVGEPISVEGFRGGRGRRALAERVADAFRDLGVD
jgi:1-acyl-sn-glycerol-3-phosphate acyltransferase